MIRLDAFDLQAPIARGGMGEVFSAVHRDTGEPVAIKVLSADAAEHADALQREIRAVAGLDHPHVIWVHDHGVVSQQAAAGSRGHLRPGSPWLAMELADAGTLAQRRGALAWSELRKVLLDLLDALAHAHARGVVHRDVKPANVLFRTEPGQQPVLKLSDFGIVHILEGSSPIVGGTPRYMAPEQFSDSPRDQGPWTDLYALGVLAFRLVSGAPPYEASTVPELRQAHTRGPIPRLRPRVDVPDGFEAWVRRLLAKPIDERYQRAADAAWTLASLPPVADEGHGAPHPHSDPDERTVKVGRQAASEPTVLVLPDGAEATRSVALLRSGGGVAEVPRPTLPTDWRRPVGPGRSAAMLGVGLRIFGLRELPMAGRLEEREKLWRALGEVERTRRPRAIVVSGPIGIGKTRFVRWLARRAHEVGAVEVFRATHDEATTAGAGTAALLSRAWQVQGATRDEAVTTLANRLGRAADHREVQRLADACDPARVGTLPPTARQLHVASTLERLARGRVPLVWLDDVQWGHDTVDLAAALLDGQLSDVAPLVVLTVDSDEIEAVDALVGRADVERIELAALPRAQRARLLRTALRLEPQLAAAVQERTAGHPLFAVQLVSDWIARGRLMAGPHGFELAPGQSIELPPSLGEVWQARLEALLGDDDWPAVELAAVLGRRVDLPEWRDACQAAELVPDHRVLRELEDAGLMSLSPVGITLAHTLLRETLEEHARAAGRLEAHHAAAATVLEARGAAADRRGRHLVGAGWHEEAVPVLLEASDRAMANAEFSHDLYLLALAERALRARDNAASETLGLVWIRVATALGAIGRYAEAVDVLARIHDLALELGDDGLMARYHETFASIAVDENRLDQAREHAQAALWIAEVSDAPDAVPRALVRLGAALSRAGDLDGAVAAYERCIEVAEGGLLDVARFGLATLLLRAGRLERAGALAAQGREHAKSIGFPLLAMDFVRLMGDHAVERGDIDRAEACYREAHAAYEEAGSPFRAVTLGNLGHVARTRGDLARAESLTRAAISTALLAGRTTWVQTLRAELAVTLAELGRWDDFDRMLRTLEREHFDLSQPAIRELLACGDTLITDPERLARLRALA